MRTLNLTMQLEDELYGALTEIARRAGKSPEEMSAEWLAASIERVVHDPLFARAGSLHSDVPEAERDAARQRFARHIGAWDTGDPDAADNARIDADLAREYGYSLGNE